MTMVHISVATRNLIQPATIQLDWMVSISIDTSFSRRTILLPLPRVVMSSSCPSENFIFYEEEFNFIDSYIENVPIKMATKNLISLLAMATKLFLMSIDVLIFQLS